MTVETKDLTKAEIEFLSDKCEKLEKQLGIAVKKLHIARGLLSAGRPFPYLALEHIEYALERIKAIDEVRS